MRSYWLNLDLKYRRAFFTIFASGLATLAKFIVMLISIPLTIGYLGAQMYGLISTVMTMCIWINTIADGGIGLSLKNAIIKHQSHGTEEDIALLSSSAFFVMLAIIVVLCFLLSIVIPFLNWQYILNLELKINQFQLVIFIITLLWATLLIIPFTLPKLIYSAYQQEYLFSGWVMLGSITGLGLQILFIKLNQGFILVGTAIQIGSFLGCMLGTLWYLKTRRNISFKFNRIQFKTFKQLFSPSIDFFLLQFTALAIYQSGVFLTNHFLGQKIAAVYSIHFQLFAYFQLIITLIISPFWSILSDAYHKKNLDLFRTLLIKIILGITIITLLFCIVMLIFGNHIIAILSHNQIKFNLHLMLILAIYHVISITIGVISLSLLAIGDTRLMSKVVIVQSLLTVGLSIGLIKLTGVLGCALASLFSIVLTIMWYSPWRFYKVIWCGNYFKRD
tara:strand:+ start:795 stop:2135 length:1341 start_codon:yes stop_codon:yes gene_type:complete